MVVEITSGLRFPEVILCLGANTDNITKDDGCIFCKRVRVYTQPNDTAMISFELNKNPRICRSAYDDSLAGNCKFTLNLLDRKDCDQEVDFDTGTLGIMVHTTEKSVPARVTRLS